MDYERTFDIELVADQVLIRVSYSGHPMERYSVVLLLRHEGIWTEARVHDNHLGTDHMHRYTRSGGKQAPEAFHAGPARHAMPAAIEHLKSHYQSIIRGWNR
jgi:hypothetical protein